MERITSDVKQELSRFGAQGGIPELVEAWPEAVGPMVAANAWPARLAPEISAKLLEKLGERAPRALRFAVGHLPEPLAPTLEHARTPAPEPTPEALRRAAELAAGIEDEELRKRVERAASLGLSIAPDDHRF